MFVVWISLCPCLSKATSYATDQNLRAKVHPGGPIRKKKKELGPVTGLEIIYRQVVHSEDQVNRDRARNSECYRVTWTGVGTSELG